MDAIKSAKLINLYFAKNLSTGGKEYALCLEDGDAFNTIVLDTHKTEYGMVETIKTNQFGYINERVNLLALIANNGQNFTQEEYESLKDLVVTAGVMNNLIERLKTDREFQNNAALCCSNNGFAGEDAIYAGIAARNIVQKQALLPILQQYIRFEKFVSAKRKSENLDAIDNFINASASHHLRFNSSNDESEPTDENEAAKQ